MEDEEEKAEAGPLDVTGWVELLDASTILDATVVNDMLAAIGKGDENYHCEGIKWSTDFKVPMVMEVLYTHVPMPDFASRLDKVSERLAPGEYLLFEEKVRHCHREESSSRVIIAMKDNVEFLEGCSFYHQLKQKVESLRSELQEKDRRRANSDIDIE